MQMAQAASSERACDLVVIGSGGAGLTGALVAALGGARVILLEKTELVGGTTAMSGGGIWIPCNPRMADVGVSDTREEALTYLRACTGGQGEDEHLVALVDHGAAMVRMLEEQAGIRFQAWPPIGGAIDYRPWLPGAKQGGRAIEPIGISLSELGPWAERLRTNPLLRGASNKLDYYSQRQHLLPPEVLALPRPDDAHIDIYWHGTALSAWLLRACLAHGVEVLTNSRATRLQLADGRIVAVEVEQDGAAVTIHAPHLLMASGGYTHNEELKRLWLTRPLDFTCDIEANEGDGHLMGMAVGAQVAGLGDAWWLPHVPLGGDGVTNLAGTREDRILPHTLMVNGTGRRFMNEATNYYDCGEKFGAKTGSGPRNFPAWLIFDRQGVERYMLLALKVPQGPAPDWLHVGSSIAELAASIGVDAVALAATIARFNGFARSGIDEDFHRGENPWDRAWGDPEHHPNVSLGTVETPPFYAIPVHPGANATRGGLRVDARGRVLSAADGLPIPGLYAAGNCSNGSAAGSYCGPGATLGPAMTFAYLAAREVVDALAAARAADALPAAE
jgi:3-oxosteroid 1-dehydrogenase